MVILDPGLPHGRKWVVEKGCECGACEHRRFEDQVESRAKARALAGAAIAEGRAQAGLRPEPKPWTHRLRFRRTRKGWVVVGPVDKVHVGVLYPKDAHGRVQEVVCHRLGPEFTEDGVLQRFGYIRR